MLGHFCIQKDKLKLAQHFGLKYWLSILTKESQNLANISQLTLHVNIDGIPLFNNSKTTLWPILGCVVELNASVFPIALFCSNKNLPPLKNIQEILC